MINSVDSLYTIYSLDVLYIIYSVHSGNIMQDVCIPLTPLHWEPAMDPPSWLLHRGEQRMAVTPILCTTPVSHILSQKYVTHILRQTEV